MMNTIMYVDPTSGQFTRMYGYIPDFYISTREPKWCYPDEKNPVWSNSITSTLNKKIKIPSSMTEENGKVIKFKEGIVEYFQYVLWGKISDSLKLQERPLVTRI